jgi:hypothetical protein
MEFSMTVPGILQRTLLPFLAAACALGVLSCTGQNIPDAVPGTWVSNQEVTVRFNPKGRPYGVARAPVAISVTIRADLSVDGWMGQARFVGCTVSRNRGVIGRTLDLFSDFVIAGKLTGSIFPADTLGMKDISMPFNVKDGALVGSVFQREGEDIFPMVSVRLQKQ